MAAVVGASTQVFKLLFLWSSLQVVMESWDSTVLDMQAACEWLVAAIGGRRTEGGVVAG
jgi:hypothetical protein